THGPPTIRCKRRLKTRSLATYLAVAFLAIPPLGAAESPWANHPDNVCLKQSPRADAPSPGFYYEGSGDFDPSSKQWIHHAGHDGIPQGCHTFTCDLASGIWQQRFPATSP